MTPYYFLIFFPMVISLVQSRRMLRIGGDTHKDVPKGALTVFFLILIGMLSCRSIDNGVDLSNYLYYFEKFCGFRWHDIWEYDLEKGYILLNWIVSRFTENYQIFLAVVAVLSLWPVYRFYKEEAESPLLTMILFATIAPFSMYFSGLRQILAMALAFPMWKCAREKKLFSFLLLVLLALQLHRSSFVMLMIYPLYHVRITGKWLIFLVPVMAAVYVFNVPIFNLMIQLFWDEKGGVVEATGATTVLLLLCVFAVYAFLIPEEKKLDRDTIAMRNVLLLTIVIQCFAPINSIAMRMNYYFLPFIPLLIPKIAGRAKRRYWGVANLSVAVLTLFFTFYFFWYAYTAEDILQVFPYIPFWRGSL